MDRSLAEHGATSGVQQAKEDGLPVGTAAKVVQVAALGQGQRAPAPAEHRPEARGPVASALVGVEHAPDHPRSGEPAQAIGGQAGTARGEGRQVPADGGQPIKDALREKHLALPSGVLQAQDGAFAWQRQVLDLALLVWTSANQPDRLATPQLGHDDPAGEPLAQGSAALARLGAAQLAQALGQAQPAAAAQVALQRVAVGVAQPAALDHLVREAAGVQVGTAFLLCPETTITAPHRAALRGASARHTALTNIFTGRPARGIVNRIIRELGPINAAAPAFPLATSAIAPLRAKAEAAGSGDFSPLWSGQNASGCRESPAAEVVRALAQGLQPMKKG